MNSEEEPIIRHVLITERINPDGLRVIESVLSSSHLRSGQQLSTQSAREMAKQYLASLSPDTWREVLGNPRKAVAVEPFEAWPEVDHVEYPPIFGHPVFQQLCRSSQTEEKSSPVLLEV